MIATDFTNLTREELLQVVKDFHKKKSEPDIFINESEAARRLGISKMTLHRRSNDPKLIAKGFPPRISLGGNRWGRSATALEKYQASLVAEALAKQAEVFGKPKQKKAQASADRRALA